MLKIVLKNYVEKKAKEFQETNPEQYLLEKEEIEKNSKLKKKKKKVEGFEDKLLKKFIYFNFDIVILKYNLG